MKMVSSILLLLFIPATFAVADCTQPGKFCHIIIVIQENRTPDNLFGAYPTFENGVDLATGGYGIIVQNGQVQREFIHNSPGQLNGTVTVNGSINVTLDPGHEQPDWVTDYHGGLQDGFCHQTAQTGLCPEYSYVIQSDVQPYFDIATNYGFANYMFQTNEGPSYEAHQFLFSGTSAGVLPNDPTYHQYFVANNASKDVYSNVGCPYTGSYFPGWVYTDESPLTDPKRSECYDRDTLVTNSNGDKVASWGYYTPSTPAIWDAPAALSQVCQHVDNHSCTGTEWTTHVHVAGNGYSDAPIFDDLFKCNLPAISWVIPDARYSDHALEDNTGLGPSFVGDIVNAVGGGMSGSTCNSTTNPLYWKREPTAIFIVWDDWGGWFDHVQPWAVYKEDSNHRTICPSSIAPNGWGCGYVSGFRVPLLVVSPYYTQKGYVSGACDASGCNNYKPPYWHDFGSILKFIETNFNLPSIDQSGDNGYADINAPDNNHPAGNVPLSDFFGSTLQNFNPIQTLQPYTCFQAFGTCTGTPYVPSGPDGDE